MKQIRDKVKSLDKKEKPSSNDSINMFDNISHTFIQLGIHNYIHKTTLFSQNVRFFNSSKEH